MDDLRRKIAETVQRVGGDGAWHWPNAERTADAILAIPEIAERDCRDCGGTGYGGHGPHIEFCTCTAGEMAIEFCRVSGEKPYMNWLIERDAD